MKSHRRLTPTPSKPCSMVLTAELNWADTAGLGAHLTMTNAKAHIH